MTNEEVRALIERLRAWEEWQHRILRAQAADALTALLARAEAAESALATVRRDTLEEAAKECDKFNPTHSAIGPLHGMGWTEAAKHLASTIRALAEQPKE